MAKFKIEARAAWAQQHGHTLRDKMVAYLPRYAPYAARISGLIAAIDGMPWLSNWLKKCMGLATQHPLPRFQSSFLSGARASTLSSNSTGKEVLLFVDTFNNHMEPENARAAQAVLEAAGYTVHFNTQTDKQAGNRPLCCGRTYLSAGMVEQAKAEARRTLDALKPFVERGIAIVGLEPSCLLSLRDEFLAYGYGDEAKQLASLSFLFEEFLVRERTAGRMQLALKPLAAQKVMLHGHCHQKAFDAFGPVQIVLNWIPQIELTVIESSCCGMAGSFGYEEEHYAASQAMAELSLFPAIRKAEENTLLVADGTSCRHQIKDGLDRDAIHVARVLAMAL
jgi:Fe-S oxidoreductase